MLDGILIECEDAIDLVLPARASCLEPCQYFSADFDFPLITVPSFPCVSAAHPDLCTEKALKNQGRD
jgi:hypothetical protein